jgi:hypothetical protein
MTTAAFWRVTILVKKGTTEFRHHADCVPGTRSQAVRHLRSVCAGLWPSATLRLVRAIPDRKAEERGGSWAATN